MEGARVYIPDEKFVWVPATILSVNECGNVFRVRVQPLRGSSDAPVDERTVDLTHDGMPDSLPLQNEASSDLTSAGAEDMCALGHLHEPAIVYNVRARFFANEPYTYTGEDRRGVEPVPVDQEPLYERAPGSVHGTPMGRDAATRVCDKRRGVSPHEPAPSAPEHPREWRVGGQARPRPSRS
uniref:Uncharacterized protein n=1 Tax=Peronospora matthiolae TaxID=2874970 RepID=A0AAV1VAE7_9STRA